MSCTHQDQSYTLSSRLHLVSRELQQVLPSPWQQVKTTVGTTPPVLFGPRSTIGGKRGTVRRAFDEVNKRGEINRATACGYKRGPSMYLWLYHTGGVNDICPKVLRICSMIEMHEGNTKT